MYKNTSELNSLLRKMHLNYAPISKAYVDDLVKDPKGQLFIHWMARPGLEKRYILYPPEFRCLIHAVIMVSRSLSKSLAQNSKVNYFSDSRLDSPEFFIEFGGYDKTYKYPDNNEELRKMIMDLASSELDGILNDDSCYGNFLGYFGNDKDSIKAGIILETIEPKFICKLLSGTSPYQLLFGVTAMSIIRDAIQKVIVENVDSLTMDKYLLVTKVYEQIMRMDLSPIEKIVELIHKYRIIV